MDGSEKYGLIEVVRGPWERTLHRLRKKYFLRRSLTAAAELENEPLIASLKRVRETWVVPPGLSSFFPLFPTLNNLRKKPALPLILGGAAVYRTGLPLRHPKSIGDDDHCGISSLEFII